MVSARGTTGDGAASAAGDAARLRGWKEIGRHFGVDARTAKRWERVRGLPVRRLPGAASAPVFALVNELEAWLASRGAEADAAAAQEPAPVPMALEMPVAAPAVAPKRPWLAVAGGLGLMLAAAAAAVWQSPPPAPVTPAVSDARRLAAVAAMSERLNRVSGTVRLRAALAAEAAQMLGRVAAMPDATPALRLEAAQAYLQLAEVQNDTNRPSLRDAAGAARSLAAGAGMVAGDRSAAGRLLHGRLLLEQARAAATGGDTARGLAFLKEARAALADAPPAIAETLALAEAELAIWGGDYGRGLAAAQGVRQPLADQDVDGWLRQLRSRDLAAEAAYYRGDHAAAAKLYGEALAGAQAGLARWPDEPALIWALHRQQWNLGTTLSGSGQAQAALPHLQAARDGWLALAAADPEDESLAWWSRTARLALGEALAAAGRLPEAISELTGSLADRRLALAAEPASVERQRALLAGLGALGSVLGQAGQTVAACRLYAEAATLEARMRGAGALSRLDEDSLLGELAAGRRRICGRGDGGVAGARA